MAYAYRRGKNLFKSALCIVGIEDQRMMQHANRGGISSVKIAPIMNLFLEHSAIRPSSTVNVQGKRSFRCLYV